MNETKPKPRKPKLELRESAKPLREGPLDPSHPAALIYAEVRRAEESASLAEFARQEDSARLAEFASQEKIASLAIPSTPAQQSASQAEPARLAESAAHLARPQPDILASLPPVKGFIRLHHQLTDHLLTQLPPSEAIVYLQLYRLSWGFKKPSCIISYPRLATRCGISTRSAQEVTARLVSKGLIENMRSVIGAGKVQGIEWRIAIPASLAESTSLAESATNIDKDLKENFQKGNELLLDTTQCPDCHGTGFYYPHGSEKGVAKCRHVHLPKIQTVDMPSGHSGAQG